MVHSKKTLSIFSKKKSQTVFDVINEYSFYLLLQASRRQLGPVRVCFSSPQELLMESIRSGKALKKTSGPPEPKSTIMRKFTHFVNDCSNSLHDDAFIFTTLQLATYISLGIVLTKLLRKGSHFDK